MLKKARKVIALVLLSAFAVMGLNIATVNAANEKYSIIVTNTVEDTGMSIKGKTFTAYKVFNVTYPTNGLDQNPSSEKYSYTLARGFENFTFNNVAGQEIANKDVISTVNSYSGNEAELKNFAVQAYKWAKGHSVTSYSKAAGDAENVEIPIAEAGYYVVTGVGTNTDAEVFSGCALTTTNPKANVIVKGDAPDMEKVITSEANTIGSKVDFQINGTVPDLTGFNSYTYTMHDTMNKAFTPSGAVIGNAPTDVAVEIGGKTLSSGVDFTVSKQSASEGTKFDIVLNDLVALQKSKDFKIGDAIKVTYSATLNTDASTNLSKNAVNLEYSNDPSNPSQTATKENDPNNKNIAIAYTLQFNIDKYEKGHTDTKLKNAKFVLKNASGQYYQWTGTAVEWVTPEGGEHPSDEQITASGATIITTDVHGSASIKGLSATNATYALHEMEAPEGYNKLAKDISLAVATTNNADKKTLKNVEVTIDGDSEHAQTLTPTDGTSNVEVLVKVENSTGGLLPSTGGIGTTIFYVVGAILMLGGLVMMIRKRKHEN